MQIIRRAFVVSLVVFIVSLAGEVSAHSKEKVYQFPVRLRSGVKVKTGLTVYKNPHQHHGGKTVFMLHGLSHTAKTYEPLVKRLFKNSRYHRNVSRAIVIDLPGRGFSGNPYGSAGLKFGELTLDDYRDVVIASLEEMRDYRVYPEVIIAHSMGGVIIQMVQEKLLSQHRSLRSRYKVREAVLLSPVFPKEVTWNFAESGQAAILIAPFVTATAELGTFLDLPIAAWIGLFYTGSSGIPSPDAPSPATIVSEGYNSNEAGFAVFQMVGAGFDRPSVRKYAFHRCYGTRLSLVSYAQDDIFFIHPDEHKELYRYLTGDWRNRGFHVIDTGTSVHDTYVSDPAQMDAVLTPIFKKGHHHHHHRHHRHHHRHHH